MDREIKSLKVPIELRSKLAKPLGELVKGTPEEVSPILKERFEKYSGILITVGDVVTKMCIDNKLMPSIVVTDGITKRVEFEEKIDFSDYKTKKIENKPALIEKQAWLKIREIVEDLTIYQSKKYHIQVDGEEDLLVIPLMIECEGVLEYTIIYGQPNEGAVLISSTLSKTFLIEEIIKKMETIQDGN
jgi:uncharacterized protein (UPF0218 family)